MTQLIIPTTTTSPSVDDVKGISQPTQDHTADPTIDMASLPTNGIPSSSSLAVLGNEHPLQTAWTFWYDKKVRLSYSGGCGGRKESDMTTLMDSAHYAKNLKEIHTFETVEEFYRAFTFIKKPSELPVDFNISLFRKGYKPMWEEFPKGGMWIIRIKRGQTIDVKTGRSKKRNNSNSNNNSNENVVVHVPLIDVMWENLVLASVGELFAMPEVVGTVLSVRSKENVLSLWNTDNDNPAVRFRIGQKLREICALPTNTLMRYKDFQQAMKDCSSYRNAQKFLFTSDENDIKTPQGRKNSQRPPVTVTACPSTISKSITVTPPPNEDSTTKATEDTKTIDSTKTAAHEHNATQES